MLNVFEDFRRIKSDAKVIHIKESEDRTKQGRNGDSFKQGKGKRKAIYFPHQLGYKDSISTKACAPVSGRDVV